MATDGDGTITAADIARLAGVGRAAVSNWRRRYEDFPAPVAGSASSPLYALSDIRNWLREAGKSAEVPLDERLWQRLRAHAGGLGLGATLAEAGAFLVYLHRDPADWTAAARGTDAELSRHLTTAIGARADRPATGEEAALPAVDVLRELAEHAGEHGAARTYAYFLGRFAEEHARRTGVPRTEVTAAIAALTTDGEVYDPGCGTGELLAAAARARPIRAAGQDADAAAAGICAARLALHDVPARIGHGHALWTDRFAHLAADSVLCDLMAGDTTWRTAEPGAGPWEYGVPPRGEGELAWLQHALAHARPGGRVIALLPAAVASRRSGRRIRAALLRAGALRAIVALPTAAFAGRTPAPHLWLLTRPAPGCERPSRIVLSDAGSHDLERACAAIGRAGAVYAGEATGDGVEVIDLLDDYVDLNPARHTAGPEPRQAADGYTHARDLLRDAVDTLRGALPELVPARPADHPTTTLADQAKAGGLELLPPSGRLRPGSGSRPVLTGRDVVARRPASERTPPGPGHTQLRSGDVVAALIARRAAVRVIDEPAVLGPGLLAIRPDPARFDPYFLAGFVAVAGRRAHAGGTVSRTDLRHVRIPLLPIGEQRRYGAVFADLWRLAEAAEAAGRLGAQLLDSAFAGIEAGALRPPPE